MDFVGLISLDEAKMRLGVAGTDSDDIIASCIADVTAEAAAKCNRKKYGFDQADVDEFPELEGAVAYGYGNQQVWPLQPSGGYMPRRSSVTAIVHGFQLQHPPIALPMTALYLSRALPRVYDATTLLVEGTDFFVNSDSGWVDLTFPAYLGHVQQAIRAVYRGGYASSDDVPGALRSIAVEVVSAKWKKRKAGQYHLTSESLGDGSIQGIKWDDWAPHHIEAIEHFRVGDEIGVA